MMDLGHEGQSFDFYDTLVTRIVGSPADIFSLVGERLKIAEFRRLRLAAEPRARRVHGGEVTFDQIYEFVALPEETRKRACALEVELESSLITLVNETASTFRAGDLIITDMYHGEAFFQNILSRLLPDRRPSRVYISGSLGISKANGRIWQRVAADFPNHRVHIGDNLNSDVLQPSRNNFRTVHYTGTKLNSYEATLANRGLDGSLCAGASKAARARLTTSRVEELDTAVISVFASVIAPLLFCFAEWIIDECQGKGINRAFFLARDGILPFRICKALCEARGLKLDCRYLYGSRHALHLPGFTDVKIAQDWLLANPRSLSLRIIANRGEIPFPVIQNAAAEYMASDLDRTITREELGFLPLIIRNSTVIAAINEASSEAYTAAISYYRSVGLMELEPVAFVDIGWNGRMQRSLRALLDKCGSGPSHITGMYLCLSHRPDNDPRNTYRGYLFEAMGDGKNNAAPFYERYTPVLESALTAPEPMTRGFQMDGSIVRPVFANPLDEAMVRRIRLQHATVEEFTANIIKLEKAAGRRILVPFNAVVSNTRRFLGRPSRQDASAFSDFTFVDGQTEHRSGPVCRKATLREISFTRRSLGYWPEGTLSGSGHRVLAVFLHIVRRIKWALTAIAKA